MSPQPAPDETAFSQFQLIGGMKHEPADTFLLIEPGGAMQQRKGALYLGAEAAGEPALGGEACQLVLGAVAREYYGDSHPTVTAALTEALNRANQALIQFNRQALAAEVAPGLPRKIRVGLTAAVAKGGQLYLCQLKPSFAIFVHDGELATFPRPRHWPEEPPQLSSDGVLMPNLYPGMPLGSGPAVEVDFAHRRFGGESLLVLCSSNLAPLLDPIESREWLAGRSSSAVIEYLQNLARSHGLAEAHAVAIDALGGNTRRSTGLLYLDSGQGIEGRGQKAEGRTAGDRQTGPIGRSELPPPLASAGSLPAASAAMPAYLRGRLPAQPATGQAAAVPPPAVPGTGQPVTPTGSPGGETFGRVMEGVGKAGKAAAPVVGKAGRMVGKAGKKTLGAAGALLQQTLPENVRQHGAAGMLSPPESDLTEEEYEEVDEYEYEDEEEFQPRSSVLGEAYGMAPARRKQLARPAWLRWAIPVAIVALLGVLIFSVAQVMAGQQAAKIEERLKLAQQEETAANATGDTAERRQHLMEAQKLVEEALDIDAGSAAADRLGKRIQTELDDLDNVARLTTISLLADLDQTMPRAERPSSGQIAGLALSATVTTTIATTDTAAATPSATASGDYLSQLLVRGDDVFLLDRGTGRLHRYSLATREYTTLLGTGDSVSQVGDAANPAKVGQLLFVTWRPTGAGGDLAVLDDTYHVYLWRPDTGQWQAFALGGVEGFARPQDMGAYDGNLYLLRGAAGQVTKWAAGAFDQPGVNWLTDQAASEIRTHNPLAMAIDGEIHILLGNGQVVTAAGGAIKKTTPISVWPPIVSPLSIFAAENASSLYVVEASDKRIIRVDKATGALQGQLKAPVDNTAFDALRNVYVDEPAGKIYILSGQRLYSAGLPSLAKAPAASATPTLRPVEANP